MNFRIAPLAALTAFVFAFATPAQADWLKAESEHFVVYADDSEKDVARFAEILERYHAAMEKLTGRESDPPSPSNRVTIYAVGSQRDVRDLAGGSKFLGGYYIPRAGASAAFVPDARPSSGQLERPMITLLHEYAHHFFIGSNRFAMPVWINEGAAEFFASARFPKDGGVEIGRPADHRAMELRFAVEVPIEELLSRTQSLPTKKNARYDSFYGQSWALYHYLTFEPSRQGQLSRYGRLIADGQSSLDAARQSFGDLQQLEKELGKYIGQRTKFGFVFGPENLAIGPVSISRLSDGLAEMMPTRIRSKSGVNAQQAQEVVAQARAIAEKYPDDAHVLAALAEAEQDVKNHDAAVAAADRAIAIDPTVKDAYIQKGYALFDKAVAANDDPELLRRSLGAFSALNKLEIDHPTPLIFYYRISTKNGQKPSENAKHAIEQALKLAPFDRGLAMNVGKMQAREGKITLARETLAPAAASPHGDRLSRLARLLIDQLATVPEGMEWTPGMTTGETAQGAAAEADAPDEEEPGGRVNTSPPGIKRLAPQPRYDRSQDSAKRTAHGTATCGSGLLTATGRLFCQITGHRHRKDGQHLF